MLSENCFAILFFSFLCDILMSLWCFVLPVLLSIAASAHALAQVSVGAPANFLPENLSGKRLVRISTEQGLSSRALTSAVQDRSGFLWFGTQNGLNRYDGVTTTVFSAIVGDTTTLPDNAVTHLHEDKRGRLWVATKSGLALYQSGRRAFTTFLRGQSVADITEDSRGVLWLTLRSVGTKTNALCLFNPETAEEVRFEEAAHGLRSAYLYDVLEDKRGTVWLGTANGLYKYNRTTANFTAFLTDTASSGAFAKALKSHVHALCEDMQGTLWIGTDGGLGRCADREKGTIEWFRTDGGVLALHCDRQGALWAAIVQAGAVANTLRFERVSEGIRERMSAQTMGSMGKELGNNSGKNNATSTVPIVLLEGKIQRHRMAVDSAGTLWWGVGNGVIAFCANNSTLNLLLNDVQSPTRIASPVVAAVVDKESNVPFFIRANQGVERFTEVHSSLFRHYAANNAHTSSAIPLLSARVSALYEAADGALWIGYANGAGASRYDRKSGTTTHFRQDPANPASVSGLGGETSVAAFLNDKRGQMWLGVYAADRWNGGNQGFTHFPVMQGQIVPVTAFVEDRFGTFWVGSKLGLAILDRTTGRVQRFVNKPNDETSLGNNVVNALLEDRAGRLWIAHEGGLDRYDAKTKQFQHFRADASNPQSLLASAVTCLHEDMQGRFWVGTRGGLHLFDREKGVVAARYLGRAGTNGLPDSHIASLVSDTRGALWISTPRGLCRFVPEKNAFRTYNASDGLPDGEFLDRAAVRTSDGALWFGSASGITTFHPDSILPNLHPPTVVLTEVRKFGVPAVLAVSLPTLVAEGRPLELGYDDKVVSIDYAALDFAGDAAKAHYAYKLEGFDTDWLYVGGQREAKYTNLPPGTYTLRVKAANGDGVWNESGVSLRVMVLPPWWLAWWFLSLVGCFVVAAFWGVYRWRVRSIQQRNKELERLVDERTDLLQSANTEVGRQLEILHVQAQEIEIANAQLQEINLELDHTVTELKGTQAQLVQSERLNAAGMLTAGVMHEINNPNSSVFSALELVEGRLDGLERHFLAMLDERDRGLPEATGFVGMISKTREILAVALNGSERIKNIVAALQGFTKHQHDGRSKNNIAAEIHTTVTMFCYQFKDVCVEESIPTDWRIEGMWAELNQAILNLLVNAAQAGATKIAIIADPVRNGTITIRIVDNGDGMDTETQTRIFEPFFTTRSVGNSGLGLSITQKIIERHGGSITVESRAGDGTTFQITLPAH